MLVHQRSISSLLVSHTLRCLPSVCFTSVPFLLVNYSSYYKNSLRQIIYMQLKFWIDVRICLHQFATRFQWKNVIYYTIFLITFLTLQLGVAIRGFTIGHIPPTSFILVTMGSTAVLLIGWRALLHTFLPSGQTKRNGVYKRGNPFEFFEVRWLNLFHSHHWVFVHCSFFFMLLNFTIYVNCSCFHRWFEDGEESFHSNQLPWCLGEV